MSREQHLTRGSCCYESRNSHSRCVHCPWFKKPEREQFIPDPRILTALISGKTATIESEMKSLVPSVVLCERVTINYQPYFNSN